MAVEVVAYREEWPIQFERIAGELRRALAVYPAYFSSPDLSPRSLTELAEQLR